MQSLSASDAQKKLKRGCRTALVAMALPAIITGLITPASYGQKDPGVRGGLNNTGGGLQAQGIPIPHPPVISPNPNHPNLTLSNNELQLFLEGIRRAGQLESTCESCSTPALMGVGNGNPVGPPFVPAGTELDPDFPQTLTNSNGLGTRHNGESCFMCHAQPIVGGSGGFIAATNVVTNGVSRVVSGKGQVAQNPEFELIPHRFGKQNTVPVFEQQFGPIREVRFKFNPDGTRNGGVHQLWVTTGIQTDPFNTACKAQQFDFATELANNNLSFRIPLQLFGLGLIESIPDRTILANHAAALQQAAAMGLQVGQVNAVGMALSPGIAGHPNTSGNDGTITRFGWKAQNKSIAIFAGEAYNVEMGITNDVFPNAVDEQTDCAVDKGEPNDINRIDTTDGNNQAFNNPLHELPDWQMFLVMMREMDAPQPAANPSASAQHGATVFNTVGCALCHTPTMQTGGGPVSSFPAGPGGVGGSFDTPVLVDRPVNLFSDLMVHHMGPGLADNIVQGNAGPDEFRTVPLWGVGQRIFFLHDGRTSDLLQAIGAHASGGDNSQGNGNGNFLPSEANEVIGRFNNLSPADQQSILDFLRSL
jgi:CxxC motif-containing protein (DUF1111 family)